MPDPRVRTLKRGRAVPSEEEITLSAIRMLAEYRSDDGRRFHPDDTLAMIKTLVDSRHPDLDWSGNASKAKLCGYCGDRGYVFNDKSWSPEWVGEKPGWDNYGFSLCTCPRAADVDMTETPTEAPVSDNDPEAERQ